MRTEHREGLDGPQLWEASEAGSLPDSKEGRAEGRPRTEPRDLAARRLEREIVTWRWLARMIASHYFIAGADRDDVEQEALIGLAAGLRAYDPSKGSLRLFLQLVIERQIQTKVRMANAAKHRPLTESARSGVGEDGESCLIVDLIPQPGGEPHERLEIREQLGRICEGFRRLSPLEQRALIHIVDGRDYRGDKSIDNAAQRARRKLHELERSAA